LAGGAILATARAGRYYMCLTVGYAVGCDVYTGVVGSEARGGLRNCGSWTFAKTWPPVRQAVSTVRGV